MLTVLEALTKSAEYLNTKGIESARMNAELLLASILNCKRLELYLMYDRPMKEDELKVYREYLKRRSTFEPHQYIVGKVEFYGLELKVSKDVLIPRPETEILIETILNCVKKEEEFKILDIGSGSGNISIALAVNLPNVIITGVDISDSALAIAVENARRYNLDKRISFIKKDIIRNLEESYHNFDIVVSNPPYVSKNDFSMLQREIRDYEPEIAVTDFSDGYKFYNRIVNLSRNLLKSGGRLFFEIAEGQSENVKELLVQNNFTNISVIKDYQRIDRVISGVIS